MPDSYIRKNKKLVKIKDPFSLNTTSSKTKELIWIDYFNPTKEELNHLAETLKIDYHDLALAMDEDERPRIEYGRKYSFIIFDAPLYKKHVYTATLGIYLKSNFVITIHCDPLKSIEEMKENLFKVPCESSAHIVHHLLKKIVRNFDASLDEIEDVIDAIESDLLRKVQKDYTEQVFPIKRTLIYFRKALKYNTDIIKSLKYGAIFDMRSTNKMQGNAQEPHESMFENLYEDIRQLIDEEAISRERMTEIVHTNLNTQSTELNKVMKTFTVIATVIFLPSIITGIYGMNFKYIPELGWKFGYPFALFMMLGLVTVTLLFYRKKKWL